MVQVSYPGVYIREIPSGVRTITGVSTSIALFVGMVKEGPLNVPTNVLNFTDYERIFGSDTSISEMTDQVRLFFQNGGKSAYIMRIANGAERAQVKMGNEFSEPVITLAAKDYGILGNNIRIEVDYKTLEPEATFNLNVFREVINNGEIEIVDQQTHTGLSMNPLSGRFINSVLDKESALITVLTPEEGGVPSDDLPVPIQGYSNAGILLSGANDLSRIVEAIQIADPDPTAGVAIGRFEISVDGGPFVTISLRQDVTSSANGFQQAINDALRPLGSSVTVITESEVDGGGPAYLAIISDSSGGSVRIRRAANQDIAGLLGLGTDNGGLEVDGYAVQRPAPTGFFSRLGSLDFTDPATALNSLSLFLSATEGNLTTITVNDAINSAGTTAPPNFVGSPMWSASIDPGNPNPDATEQESLLNGSLNLNAIVEVINKTVINDAGDPVISDQGEPAIKWTAERSGYRIILTPDFGNADGDISATIDNSVIGTGTDGIWGTTANVARYRLGNYSPIGVYAEGTADGFDGTVPQLEDYEDAYVKIARDVDIFNLLILPRAFADPRQTDEKRAGLWGSASIFCERQRAFLLIDPPSDRSSGWTTAQQARDSLLKTPSLRTGLTQEYAAVYWPRLKIIDRNTGSLRAIDPSGAIAGIMARIDANRGVWKAPAGLEADIRGIRGIEYNITDPENGIINPQAVNAIRSFPNGIVSWGARTIAGFNDNPNADYRYIPVRRIALFIEESLFRGLKFAVFEPNDEPLWAQIRLAAGAFMNNLFRQGAFQGQKARDAYFVKCDSETTTQNDINLGIVNVLIGFAPLKPAEFVVITIQQIAGQVQT